jgi:hypothetical protein
VRSDFQLCILFILAASSLGQIEVYRFCLFWHVFQIISCENQVARSVACLQAGAFKRSVNATVANIQSKSQTNFMDSSKNANLPIS